MSGGDRVGVVIGAVLSGINLMFGSWYMLGEHDFVAGALSLFSGALVLVAYQVGYWWAGRREGVDHRG